MYRTYRRKRVTRCERCEPRHLLAVEPFISEFMASNDRTLKDEFGESSDWIEIANPDAATIELDGWYLTDNAENLTKWKFPKVQIEPDEYLVVYASNRNLDDSESNLHTNFKLAKDGEYLALVKPDGKTVVSEFGASYPAQFTDVSYGVSLEISESTLIAPNTPAQILIPQSGDQNRNWTAHDFEIDDTWITESANGNITTTPVGFDHGTIAPDLGQYAELVSIDQPTGYWRLEETARVVAANDGLLGNSANGQYLNNARQITDGVLRGSGDHGVEFQQSAKQGIEVPFQSRLNPRSFTIEVWAKATGGGGHRSPLSSRNALSREGYVIYATPDNDWEFWTGKGTGWNIARGPSIELGKWTHLVGTYDHVKRTQTFYVNGIEVSSINATALPNDQRPLRIGSGETKDRLNFFFEGAIDEVAVFDHAITQDRIHAHYQAGKPLSAPVFTTDIFVADFRNPDANGLGPDASRLVLAGKTPQSPTIVNPNGRLVLGGGGNGSVVFVEELPTLTFDQPVSIRTTAFWETGQAAAGDNNARFGLVALHRQGTEGAGPNRKGGLFAQFQPQTGGVADLRLGFQTDTTSNLLDSFVVASTKPANGDFDPNGEFELELVIDGLEDSDSITFHARQATYSAEMQTTVANFRRGLINGSSTQQAFDVVLAELREDPGSMNVGFISTAPFGGVKDNIDAYRDLLVSVHTPSPEPDTLDYSHLLNTDIGESMVGVNATAFIRVPFTSQQAEPFDRLNLNMQYDDGFVAFLNGTEIARRNAPTDLTWNSVALGIRPDVDALIAEKISVSLESEPLRTGKNVLGILALNASPNNPDLFVQPELTGHNIAASASQARYLSDPTPGTASLPVENDLGPVVYDVQQTPNTPIAGQDVIVSAFVADHSLEVDSVTLNYRVMYGDEVRLNMSDNGQGADEQAGDGIYTATIPGGVARSGQMLRYFVESSDAQGHSFRSPRTLKSPTADRAPKYHGTMIANTNVRTPLPVFSWFVPNPNWHRSGGGNNKNWSPASVYFDGIFYDNLQVRVRGLTTVSWRKPKFKFEFNNGYEFQYSPDQAPVDEFNLQSHFRETGAVSYMGETLAFNWLREIGVPAPLVMPMHVRQNGGFYSLATFVEQIDQTFLERNGFDPNGAMYKANSGTVMSTLKVNPSPAHYRKVTRKDEPFDDLKEFTNGINNRLRGVNRSDYIFDTVNLPQVINDMAGNVVMPNHDRLTKNYYMHFDVLGNGEWSRFPWDMDQAFSRFTANHFASVLYGDSQHPQSPDPIHQNHLYDAILDTPATRAMYLRRVRTLIDDYMATGYFAEQVDAYFALLQTDADRDHSKWRAGDIRSGVNRIKDNLRFRRRQLLNEGLLPAAENSSIQNMTLIGENAAVTSFVPQDDSLALDWTKLDFDDQNWTAGVSGIGYDNRRNPTYLPEINTMIEPRNTCDRCVSIYSRFDFDVEDPSNFNTLTLPMKYDDGFIAFLNGIEIHRENFSGTPSWNSVATRASSNGAAYVDFDVSDHIGLLKPGKNVLAIQALNATWVSTDLLVRPQLLAGIKSRDNLKIAFGNIDFNPTSGNQDEEFIQLVNNGNQSVDISGWKVQGGVEYEFQPGTVLPANDSLYLSPDVRAFRGRTSGPTGGKGLFVQGNYDGHLSNFGETVELYTDDGTFVTSQTSPADPSALQQFLRISEIHYHPDSVPDAEFMELVNIAGPNGTTLDLAGVTISQGPSEPFAFPSEVTLDPGQVILVVKDQGAFSSVFENVDGRLVAGEFMGSLNNSGEAIKIEAPDGSTIVDLNYDDTAPWPDRADGNGASLQLRDLHLPMAEATSWVASTPTPGQLLEIKDVDLNQDGRVDTLDLDRLCAAIHANDTSSDVNDDGQLNQQDLDFFVQHVLGTTIGDVNLDGVFNSADLVRLFQLGEYEDGFVGNSTWASGDWNCDGEFSTSDLVAAFRAGGFREN